MQQTTGLTRALEVLRTNLMHKEAAQIQGVVNAAQLVTQRWAKGDLAGPVRQLTNALKELCQ